MTDPQLLPSDAAVGARVAISVSDSADLARLGLTQLHCRLAIAELARAVFIAGGSILYGGDLRESGFSWVLVDEARRYSTRPKTLTICLARSVHGKMDSSSLRSARRSLGNSGAVLCLDENGQPGAEKTKLGTDTNQAADLTAMRRFMTSQATARVVVGGRLSGYSGSMPGVLEEALLTVRAAKPLYAAGGFGGASLAVCRALGTESAGWAPYDLPTGIVDVSPHLEILRDASHQTAGAALANGLTDLERAQLAVTHRPGDIASLVMSGLSKLP